MTFPFSEESVKGIGVIISEVATFDYEGEDIKWVWILDENGNKLDFSLDYIEPVIT